MFKDRKSLVVIEYIIGFSLLIAVLPSIVHPRPGWSDAHGWAYLLFIVCAAFTLLSCASEMRKRLEQSHRIEKLEKMVEQLNSSQKHSPAESSQKNKSPEHLVSSLN